VNVYDSVKSDLDEIAKVDKRLADSGLASLALAMAAEIDNTKNSATSKAMCAGRLHEAMERLRELTPERREADELDDLRAKREKRRAKAAG